jgi:CHAD domain-containing protein
MADGKWITGLRPDMHLEPAARHTLAQRLEVVRDWLPRAVHEADQDPESVHQLRVGTRRADAALRIFRDCLPGRVYRAARERLRTIRRAAGAARDWDVFLLDLRQRSQDASPEDLAGLDFLAGYASGQRSAVQVQLEAVEVQPETFVEFIVATLEELRDPDDNHKAVLGDLARSLLVDRLGKLHATASGDLTDYGHLHQVRIAGKRLRYALEVVADCFVPALRERLYPLVEEMQDILGRANDSHVASGRMRAIRTQLCDWGEMWKRLRPGVDGLLRFHQRRVPQERRRFLKWWEQWCAAGAEEILSEPVRSLPAHAQQG